MLEAAFKALAQMISPEFRRVLFKAIGLALIMVLLFGIGLHRGFSWLAENDTRKLKLAALCQFTLSGPPVVYNGSEVGVRQHMGMWEQGSEGMAECRQPMLWGEEQDADLREFYRWLIHFRREHPVLWHGRRQTIPRRFTPTRVGTTRWPSASW